MIITDLELNDFYQVEGGGIYLNADFFGGKGIQRTIISIVLAYIQ